MSFVFKVVHHFIPPTTENLIETIPFLDASSEILVIIDYLGPSFLKSAFHRTRSDISGNITTLRNKYDVDPVKYSTLNAMLEAEKNEKQQPATISLLWLKRGLELVYHFSIQLVDEGGIKNNVQNLCNMTLHAYNLSLKRFHNYLLQGLFYLVAHILPSRKEFVKLLAGGQYGKEDEVYAELKLFVDGLSPNLEIINKIYIEMGRNEEY